MSRALVLGGGGPVGIGWESGLLVGLAAGGVRLSDADRVIGTSAGSVVGARLSLGRDLAADVERVYSRRPDGHAPSAEGYQSSMGPRMEQLRAAMLRAAESDAPREQALRELGRFALDAPTAPEAQFVGFFAELAGQRWPQRFACTAVDAETGEFAVWDESAGVGLDRAVASSCSVPGVYPPITLHGRRYIDGGMRSAVNADLAAGHAVAVVVSVTATPPADARAPFLQRLRRQRETELAALHDAGTIPVLIEPDPQFSELSGAGLYLMDAPRAPAAFDLGVALGRREAERVGAAWG